MIENNVKKRFQADVKRSSSHKDLVVNEWFLAACDAAMLKMINDMQLTYDPVMAAVNHQRAEGAKMFLAYLLNIAENQTQPKSVLLTPNLTHNA